MKSDSPPSTLRRRDFMSPPCILASTTTPSDVAIIAPASARTASPPAMAQRTTANDGVWRTWISIGASSGLFEGARLHRPGSEIGDGVGGEPVLDGVVASDDMAERRPGAIRLSRKEGPVGEAWIPPRQSGHRR